MNGRLVYVGKAVDGIRKRFVQYYNGTTAHYPSGASIHDPEWNERSGWGE